MLKEYFREKIKTIAYFVLLGFLYMLFAVLFHEPLVAVIYPFIIAMVVGLIFLLADYTHTRNSYKLLREMSEAENIVEEELPSDGVIAGKYRELIEQINQKCLDREAMADKKIREAIDYYTLWAHQVKTPISAMRLTLAEEDSDMSRRLSGDLLRVEQYVDMVLNYIRLDSDSTDYVIKESRLDDIIRPVIKKYAGEFISRRLSLEYKETDDCVLTDEKWLSFVLEQIISNALKYTRSGCIKIYKTGDELIVEDMGIGIAASDVPRVFEKGYTGNIGREDKRASGIGLFLSKQIMERLGHGIRIESEQDKGTRVYLNLNRSKLWVE